MILELCERTYSSFPHILKLKYNCKNNWSTNWHNLGCFTSFYN